MSTKAYFTNGVPELLILQLLSRDEMYGYELASAIRTRSNETFQFGEGCLYPVLHRLADAGYLVTRQEMVSGRPRYYYKASARGLKQLANLLGKWTSVVRGAQRIIDCTYAY